MPKTIDNDLPYCDRTFGFATAVEAGAEVLNLAHNEAKGAPRGIGLVKLMGRNAGFIACGATLASLEVNFTLIPEVPFKLEGPTGLLAILEKRMDQRQHAVIVVAEGAGQDLLPPAEGTDASGNRKLQDIGTFLKEELSKHFRQLGKPVDIKYIDPSYIVRSVAANSSDAILCDQYARRAVHAALAGRTDTLIGYRNGKFIHVPIELATVKRKQIDPERDMWSAVLAATGQPSRIGF